MPLPVNLHDVIDAVEPMVDGWVAFINRRTGEIVAYNEDDATPFGTDGDSDAVPEWQLEVIAKAAEVEASDDFVPLPDRYDIHEYAIMERFCHSVEDDALRAELLDAIRGSGAFRRFKDAVRRRDLEPQWWACRDAAIEAVVADFLEAEGIPFEGLKHG